MRCQLPNLELLEYKFKKAVKGYTNAYERDESNVVVFEQVWRTTALGFEGPGGSMKTHAYTTVITTSDRHYAAVFWGNELGYLLEDPNEQFFQDVRNYVTASAGNRTRYLKG